MEKYEAIEMEVIAFETENVIVTSDPIFPQNDGNTGGIGIPT